MITSFSSRLLRFVAASLLGGGLFLPLRADLMVVQGLLNGNYDSQIYRFDDTTGTLIGRTSQLNEGWTGACRDPYGQLYAVTNVLGQTDVYAFDAAGSPVTQPVAQPSSDGSVWYEPRDLFFGPDGSLYGEGFLSTSPGRHYGIIKVRGPDFTPGKAFIDTGSQSDQALTLSTFGPDGNLYAASSAGIVRYNGQTGAAMGTFIPLGTGGLAQPTAMIFGPDGALYVGSSANHSVLKFDGASGAFIGIFIAAGSGGLNQPMDFAYGPDGKFYVASYGSNAILRYDPATGAFIDAFVSGAPLKQPRQIVFARDNTVAWVDDETPAGASLGATGGDSWNWVGGATYSASSAPISGRAAHVATNAPGLHEHFFNFAAPLQINTGDRLFAYVHVDSANPPREIMLSWAADGSWEHRAIWGGSWINAGVAGTESHYAASRNNFTPSNFGGRWWRLEIPAAAVGLEGKDVTGMSFSLYDGRVTWDRAGKSSSLSVDPIVTDPPDGAPAGLWFAGELPAGAWSGTNGGDVWSWTHGNGPYADAVVHPSAARAGLHEHYLTEASQTMTVGTGSTLFGYVRLDPAAPPSEIMLSWFDGTWEHRAYWGANTIAYGNNDTAGRHHAGPLPAAGPWTRLEIPAAAVGLEGRAVSGLSFSLFDGGAEWSGVGVTAGTTPPPPPPPPRTETGWFDDAFPAGAQDGASGAGAWTWMANDPVPQSGTKALSSTAAAGPHEHYFNFAWEPLTLAAGDAFFIYVYLDPANPPQEIMLSFCADSWEHRAYWGANSMSYATDGSPAQYRVGALPAAGQWVRLEVPANAIGLEARSVTGMSMTLSNGRATFDHAGKLGP
jgi:DNA-binding beta-propeller fold protein YncE